MGEIFNRAIQIYEHKDAEERELRKKASETGAQQLTHLQVLTLNYFDTMIAELHGESIATSADRELLLPTFKPQEPAEEPE